MLIGNGSTSAIVSSQVVPVASPLAIFPPPALQPIIGQGAYANNLPSSQSSMTGGAIGGTTAALTGNTGGGASAEGTIGNVATDMSSLPIWKQPIFLTFALLVIGYLLLRYVHWGT